MSIEIEVKFLDVDFDDIRKKLTDLGATLEQPMRLMRRLLIRTPDMTKDGRDAFIRLRDEGHRVTLTFKDFKEQSLTGTEEREVVVSDFDTTREILAAGGLTHQSFQESRRETWQIGDVEVVLDQWPWLNPYIEIEGQTEDAVKETAMQLGFDWKDAIFGSVTVAFRHQYPAAINANGLIDLPEVKFGAPIPDIFKAEGYNKTV